MELSFYSIPGIEEPMDQFIERTLVSVFGVPMENIMIKKRSKHLVIPRMSYVTAMCRYNGNTQWGMSSLIFDRWGINYDHSTVHHAEETIEGVYLPGKVSNATDRIFAGKVQEFFEIVKSEYKRQHQKRSNENNSSIRTGERIRIAEINMLVAKGKLS
jgi:hypothetical protein